MIFNFWLGIVIGFLLGIIANQAVILYEWYKNG